MAKFASREDEWKAYLVGTHPRSGSAVERSATSHRLLDASSARCRTEGRVLFGRLGFGPWDKNPNICRRCVLWLAKQEVSGAEVETTFLFADVRRSSDLARRLGTMEFTHLMQRFYAVASDVLIADEAIIEKFVGDEVVAFFVPLMTGPNHAAAAVRAAEHLLLETGHGDEGGPWLPLGAGVHTGVAFVGMVSRGSSSDFTAFGNPINVAAHLAGQAAVGEVLITDTAMAAAGLARDGLEQRHLSLKRHSTDAVVLPVPSASFPSTTSP